MKFRLTSFFIFLIPFLLPGVLVAESGARDAAPAKSPPVEVIFETTLGSFMLELYPDKAPKTVANFLAYVDAGFYRNTLFHRVIPGFVVQGGGFEKGMKQKPTHAPVKNESDNGLPNARGTISMARTGNPDSATSQFFINVADNPGLDPRGAQPGYAVFGRVTGGMSVVDKIVAAPTGTLGPFRDVPKKDIVILSAGRKDARPARADENTAGSAKPESEKFLAGEHYVVLDEPVATRDGGRIEVVELFSYGCPRCYEFETLVGEWSNRQAADVDFRFFPAVWNEPMKLYARAFYAARELKVAEKIHLPLFTAIVREQKRISNESELADFFAQHGVDKKAFTEAFHSRAVEDAVRQAEARTRGYRPAGAPEIVINGKYRVERVRAGGLAGMLAVADYLIARERGALKK